ncbi:MAG TPA: thrombospondin type 3 repeat-containing protein, partial [Thermomicrobiales bacterium]|nr:thrombospondin type 3 repeat-containing protein [Thermomicrobiales bacterium]
DLSDPTPNGDSDADGIDELADNCVAASNPDQLDSDGDLTGDACDPTPLGDPDTDADGIPDSQDSTPNGDTDNDGFDNLTDECPDDATNTCALPAAEEPVLVTFQLLDSVTGDPISLDGLVIAPDNGESGMGIPIFDGPGSDAPNGLGVTSLEPGNYEVLASTSDPTYFAGYPEAIVVTEGMAPIQLQLEQGGYFTFNFIDDSTGLPLIPTSPENGVGGLGLRDLRGVTINYYDWHDNVIDGAFSPIDLWPVGAYLITPTFVPDYQLPDSFSWTLIPGQVNSIDIAYVPAPPASDQIATTFQMVDSIGNSPIALNRVTITDNADAVIFTGAPFEPGTDLPNGVGVVMLEPGNYTVAAVADDYMYFLAEPVTFVVAEEMAPVTVRAELGGFLTVNFIDDSTGLSFPAVTDGDTGAGFGFEDPSGSQTGYYDSVDGAVDGTYVHAALLHAGTYLIIPRSVPGYPVPARFSFDLVPGQINTVEIHYAPYDESFIPVELHSVDSVTGAPIEFTWIKATDLATGQIVFDEPPSEAGTDVEGGIGVVRLQVGDYQIEVRAGNAFYYPRDPITLTVTDGMAPVDVLFEQGGKVTFRFVNGETGNLLIGDGINPCVSFAKSPGGSPTLNQCDSYDGALDGMYRYMILPGEHGFSPSFVAGFESPQPVTQTILAGQFTTIDIVYMPLHQVAVIPLLPEVSGNVCVDGAFIPPTVVPGTTSGLTYSVTQQPSAPN